MHLLVICGNDWQEKRNLAIFDHPPSEEEQLTVILDYWQQYEAELFPDFREFVKYLKISSQNNKTQWRKGIWIEEVEVYGTQ